MDAAAHSAHAARYIHRLARVAAPQQNFIATKGGRARPGIDYPAIREIQSRMKSIAPAMRVTGATANSR